MIAIAESIFSKQIIQQYPLARLIKRESLNPVVAMGAAGIIFRYQAVACQFWCLDQFVSDRQPVTPIRRFSIFNEAQGFLFRFGQKCRIRLAKCTNPRERLCFDGLEVFGVLRTGNIRADVQKTSGVSERS